MITSRIARSLSPRPSNTYVETMTFDLTDFIKHQNLVRMSDGQDDDDNDVNIGIVTKTRTRTRKPSMYRVVILNDDYTPMEFVVFVLERFFNKSREEATHIMLHVHNHGVGVCGVFTFEVAETKVAQVLDLARRNEHPLQCTMEKED